MLKVEIDDCYLMDKTKEYPEDDNVTFVVEECSDMYCFLCFDDKTYRVELDSLRRALKAVSS